jgi:hypothetical protein
MSISHRIKIASKYALIHLTGSLFVACVVAALVFGLWYPHPYGQLSGGLTLFLLLVSVDVVCGPLLTMVVFTPKKPRREILTDMGLIVLVQLAALAYGLHTTYQARPLFLVHEVDRFRVISLPDYNGEDVAEQLDSLGPSIRPNWFSGPVRVGIRDPKDREERQNVMLDALEGGRDYAQRPEFYVPYDLAYSGKALSRAKPLALFTERYPETLDDAQAILARRGIDVTEAKFLPVLHKQEWIAVLDAQAEVIGFLPGDGFAVPAEISSTPPKDQAAATK